MGTVRAFIAFEPPADVRAAIGGLLRKLRSTDADVRWEREANIHSTIKFLGNVEESVLERIFEAIDRVGSGAAPFRVTFSAVGGFPDLMHPRVLWVGCRDEDGALTKYKNRLDEALLPFGFAKEDRRYSPHITLGRVKSGRGLAHLLSLVENLTFEPTAATISGIVVLKSVLHPLGAEYSLLHSIQIPSP